MNISAVVVSCNEGHLLERCLGAITFCDEIIVVDLESLDNTKDVASKFNAKYIYHKKVPIVEIIHKWIQNKTIHDWILITDPDEICTINLKEHIKSVLPKINNDVGAIKVPMRVFYGDYLLKGTYWGGIQARTYIVHKERFYFTSDVHRSRNLKKGMKFFYIPFKHDVYLKHYWIKDRKQLISKHRRYLQKEGSSRYNGGLRTYSLGYIIVYIRTFYDSFFLKKGFKDGFIGLYLSFFWAWYNAIADIRLWKYQKIKQN